MIHTENDQTFLSYGELFSHCAGRCREAERAIRSRLDKLDAPYSKAMELVADAEHRLATDLAGYAEKGPDNLVCTRVQYTLEESAPAEARSLADALQNVVRVNEQLAEVLSDQADKAALDTLRETLETIGREIEAVNRRISMIRVTARDV